MNFTESSILPSVFIGNPSSMMSPSDSHFGRPPQTAMSFTVPCTARLPILPPGNSSGWTTKLSVVKISFSGRRGERRGIRQTTERVAAESGHDFAVDQFPAQSSATAVCKLDEFLVHAWILATKRRKRQNEIRGRDKPARLREPCVPPKAAISCRSDSQWTLILLSL